MEFQYIQFRFTRLLTGCQKSRLAQGANRYI